jgi:hypothetical protein
MQEVLNRARKSARWVRVGFFTMTIVGPAVRRLAGVGRRQAQRRLSKQTTMLKERAAELAGVAQQAASTVTTAAARLAEQAPVPAVPIVRRRRGNMLWWVAGVGVGLVAAGTTTYIIVRRRFAAAPQEGSVELPQAALNGQMTPSTGKAREMVSPPTSEQPSQTAEPAPAENPVPEAQFIGNVRTGIYHRANSPDLPAEENRMYFKTREEAEQMGFQPSPEEFAPEDRP